MAAGAACATLAAVLQELSKQLGLGALLSELKDKAGGYDLVDHWQQGEFHHDVVLRVPNATKLPGPVLGEVRTIHWFDPCELLRPDARSEYREDARERQPGGGWRLKSEAAGSTCAAAAGRSASSQQS